MENLTIREEWRQIPGFPGYEASSLGKIRSYWRQSGRGRGHKLADSPQKNLLPYESDGYLKVALFRDHKKFNKRVHQLVLITFIGPCPAGMQGCHNDNDRTNNIPTNLRWDTRKNNFQDRLLHGTWPSGSNSGGAKLNDSQVNEIRCLYAQGTPQTSLCKTYSVSKCQIGRIVRNESWKHLL